MPLLEAQKVSKSYGGVHALIEADFACESGEVHALLGENGAGKSTLVKILSGVLRLDSGTIKMHGQPVDLHSPVDATRSGIAAVFQELSLVPNLSVAENIYLGFEPTGRFGLIDFRKMKIQATKLLDNIGFDIPPEAVVKNLSLAQQQLVEIAKALSRDPDILILDEATSALGQREVAHLFALIERMKQDGKAIIFISHRMDEIEAIADRATVFRDARHIEKFRVGEVSNQEIIKWIVGRDVQSTFPEKKQVVDPKPILKVENLVCGNSLHGVNFEAMQGEIIGLAGLQGHGQVEFLLSLFGAYPVAGGSIKVNGQSVHLHGPADAIRHSIVLVPESRKNGGLLLPRSVRENLTLMTLDFRQVFGFVNTSKENVAIQQASELLAIKAASAEQAVNSLSGGNQQKVVIAKALLTEARILLLADPTRGIDIGTKAEIYRLIRKLSDEGKTILMYSTELMELVGLCHRVAVFYEGQVVKVLDDKQVNEHEITQAALAMA